MVARVVLTLLVLGPGCGRPGDTAPGSPDAEVPPLYFVDVGAAGPRTEESSAAALDARHDRAATGDRHLFETMGGGVACIDFDTDGDLDVFLPQARRLEDPTTATVRPRLLRNDGGGRFTDATDRSGLDTPGYGLGAAVGDVDGDGDPDLYLIRFGPNALFLNDEGDVFREKTDAGLEGPEPFSGSAAFGDLDGDGRLDLFLTSYVELDTRSPARCSEREANTGESLAIYCGPHNFRGASDRVFLNNGDGTFRDVTDRAGLRPAGPASSKSLGVLIADLDEDHDLDVFVACDTTANLYYRNRGDARFDEVGLETGVAASDTGAYEGGMGVAAGDVDGDGRLDLFVTNYEDEANRLYCALEGGRFEDATSRFEAAAGSHRYVGWGVALEDLDLDGDQDLFVANGHIFDNVELWDRTQTYRQRCLLLRFDAGKRAPGSGRFVPTEEAPASPFTTPRAHRGVAAGDFDNDGDVDLLVAALDEPLALLENRAARDGRSFLVVELTGKGPGGRDAVGARVDVVTADGKLSRWRVGGGSYLSASDHRLHFGLARARTIRRMQVTWPDGTREDIAPAPPVNAHVRVERGRGIVRVALHGRNETGNAAIRND